MGRDLKKEYEAMLDHEIPDLWSRIEPQLADKKKEGAAQSMAPVQQAAQSVSSTGGAPKRRGISRRSIAVWGSLVAACVCLAIVIPAFIRNGKMSEKQANDQTQSASCSDTSAMDDYDTDGSADAGSDAAPRPGDNGADGAMQADEDAVDELYMPEIAEEAAEDQYDKMNQAEAGSSVTDLDSGVAMGGEEENDIEWSEEFADGGAVIQDACPSQADDGEKGTACYRLTVEIVDTWETEEGCFYRGTLLSDDEENPLGVSEIVVLLGEDYYAANPGNRLVTLEKGGTYALTVKAGAADGETVYVVIQYK